MLKVLLMEFLGSLVLGFSVCFRMVCLSEVQMELLWMLVVDMMGFVQKGEWCWLVVGLIGFYGMGYDLDMENMVCGWFVWIICFVGL